MAKVIDMNNPRVSPNEDNGEHILYVSGKNNCVSEDYSEYTLVFPTLVKPTREDESMEWDELRKKINDGLPPKLNGSSQVALLYGFRHKDFCEVDIYFYDRILTSPPNCIKALTSIPICIKAKDILGLPKC
jgi:hypothetical protein